MHSRLLPVVSISAMALIAAASLAGTANAASANGSAAVTHSTTAQRTAHPAKGACYSGNIDDSLTGILSTQTDDPAGYTSAGAVDFKVKKKCKISLVQATGVYAAGSGPADTVTVTFYKSKKGLPGKVVNTQTLSGSFASPAFSLSIKPVKLKKGKYFASVQASMDYNLVGGWYWELSTQQLGKTSSAFENTGGAFGFCQTWDYVSNCYGYAEDYMLELS